MTESQAFCSVCEVVTLEEVYLIDLLYDCIREKRSNLLLDESLIFERHYEVKIELIPIGDILERKSMLTTQFIDPFA